MGVRLPVRRHAAPRAVILAILSALFLGFASESPHAQGVPSSPPVQAPGQLPSLPAIGESRTTFRAETEMVALNITVTDGQGRYVSGLSKDDFVVFEDGVPQQLSFFGTSNVPIDLALMIDTSASMRGNIGFVHRAAALLVRTLRSIDRAEVLGFSAEAQVLTAFTSDKRQLEAAIAAAMPHGSTSLYNSVYIALQDMQRVARNEHGVRRPAIVVLTDGDDTCSLVNADDLIDVARRSNVAVYTISIVSESDTKRFAFSGDKRFMTEADFTLKTLAQDTGGQAFFPRQASDLNGVYQQIAEELASQYSLAYTPKPKADDVFRRLLVRIPGREAARPRTRAGYYASRTVQAAITRPR